MAKDNIVTKTNDGYVVEIFAKTKKEIEKNVLDIAEGITLLEIETKKTEEEQFLIYKEIVEKMEYSPVVMRVCEKEKNEETLKTQLKALLRAGKFGDLSIVFPKISTITELKEIKEILEECKKELDKQDIQYKNHIKIGIVIEIPSAALMSYELARECDFLFIDTNSLTSYIFGNKSNNTKIPDNQIATIKLIRKAVAGAHDAGIYCGISGDIAENEFYIPLLIGLGIDEFSIDSNKISKVREAISKVDRYDCKELAKEVLLLRTTEEMDDKIKKAF